MIRREIDLFIRTALVWYGQRDAWAARRLLTVYHRWTTHA